MKNNNKGFTLVELMVTLALSGIIVAAIYSVYTLQQKTYTAQDQVVEMQQNIRAATMTMVRELRMAGYDPTAGAGATITAAGSSTISFSQDITNTVGTDSDGDGKLDGPNETVSYKLDTTDNTLKRSTGVGGGFQPVAENIEAMEFLYTLADGTKTTTPGDPSKIRIITLSILAKAGWRDSKFVNNTVYTQASAMPPLAGTRWDLGAGAGVATGDDYRRRILITTVQCRNMGL